jgi:hypothetical protein
MKLAKTILSTRIIIALSLVVLGSLLYWWHRVEMKSVQVAKSNNSEFYLLDPARSLYKDENLVTNIEPLRQFLKSLPEREKDKADISIYFEVLTTGNDFKNCLKGSMFVTRFSSLYKDRAGSNK